jgi:hypothetical protein
VPGRGRAGRGGGGGSLELADPGLENRAGVPERGRFFPSPVAFVVICDRFRSLFPPDVSCSTD